MKNITLYMLLMLLPSFSFAGQVVDQAKKLEAEMNATKPDFNNPAIGEISRRAAVFVNEALSSSKLDSADYLAIARIIVRAYDYDQQGDMSDCNAGLVAKHRKGLSKAVTKLVGEPGVSAEGLQMGRAFIEGGEEPEPGHVCGILRALKADGSGGGKAGGKGPIVKTPAKKAGGINALWKKSDAAADPDESEAGLSKSANEYPASRAVEPVVNTKALKHLEPVQEQTFSSFDPTVSSK